MKGLTAMELGYNYPENILIDSAECENGKFASFCYRLKDGEIHKLMLSTEPVFDSKKEAEDALKDVAIKCKEKFGE